ncbi:ubiquitin carboxyl-terminal hydrolase 15 [Anaeramoeba ignava]|uniref:ubiquitinyl hydrolase 1 n=1 Tax=Anaeramoeba ignava TaxID=1746090 RepID=A0A9Q0L7Y4_ANAIG|nr:ubiquitin carboxyl-terminal hydrolase 15 [Anaeramoeba ignava]
MNNLFDSLKNQKILLPRTIVFREANYKKPPKLTDILQPININNQNSNERQSFEILNNSGILQETNQSKSNSKSNSKEEENFQFPKRRLFNPNLLSSEIEWNSVFKIGNGFHNHGKTSYINSILQCFIYTPSFTQYILQEPHPSTCQIHNRTSNDFNQNFFCAICAFFDIVFQIRNQVNQDEKDLLFLLKNLKLIGQQFNLNQEQDAHEFYIQFLQKMIESCLFGFERLLDIRSQETTLIHSIFGGYFKNNIICSRCHFNNKVFELFLDLSINIFGSKSLEDCLLSFTKQEKIQYYCSFCRQQVLATKQLSISHFPLILVITLKRYNFFQKQVVKNNSFIKFPEVFNSNNFSTIIPESSQKPINYLLYALVIHQGDSANTGHYISYVRNSNNIWYKFDDEKIQQVSLKTVLKEKPYMIFYRQQKSKD